MLFAALVVSSFLCSATGWREGLYTCHCVDCYNVPTPCHTVCLPGWDGPFCQRQNVAYQKPSNQSGVYNQNCDPGNKPLDPFCGLRGPNLAVDGDANTDYFHGSCALTDSKSFSAWWTVDLGHVYTISRLMVYQRKKAILRPTSLEVLVGDTPCYNVSGTEVLNTVLNLTCDQPVQGSTVTVRTPSVIDKMSSLTLCEVVIFECSDGWFGELCEHRCHCLDGKEVCDKNTGACASGCDLGWRGPSCQNHNIALNMQSFQSGTASNISGCIESCGPLVSGLAVDGSRAQSVRNGSCSQTASGRDVTTWSVTLGHAFEIYRLRIYFPTDVQLDTSGLMVSVDGEPCWNTTDQISGVVSINCMQPLVGIFVSIALPLHNVSGVLENRTLSLCEVEIYECDDYWFGRSCENICKCGNSSEVCDKITGHCPLSGCSGGWMGSDCMTACSSHSYGVNCSSACGQCADNAPCDPVTGQCPGICANHFTGTSCNECLPGMYGVKCDQQCHCPVAETCDRLNGTCNTSCPPHKTGLNCSVCHVGWWGSDCANECGDCKHDVICNPDNGACPNGCDPGWDGDLCTKECVDGWYGEDCGQKCGHCVDPTPCDKMMGMCLGECADGWTGEFCQDCAPALYGYKCDQQCQCPKDGNCDRLNGTCVTPCPPHFNGRNCSECDFGWWGSICDQQCGDCRHDVVCNPDNGECPDGCDPGWQGNLCKQECADGWYGEDCGQKCGHCDPTTCDKMMGMCFGECADGWAGDLCKNCEEGFYSVDCGEPCGHCLDSDTCDNVTGVCPNGCLTGWSGDTCNTVSTAQSSTLITKSTVSSDTTITTSSKSQMSTSTTSKSQMSTSITSGFTRVHHVIPTSAAQSASPQTLSQGVIAIIVISSVLVFCISLHSLIYFRFSRKRPCFWRKRRQTCLDKVESADFNYTEMPKYGNAFAVVGTLNPDYVTTDEATIRRFSQPDIETEPQEECNTQHVQMSVVPSEGGTDILVLSETSQLNIGIEMDHNVLEDECENMNTS